MASDAAALLDAYTAGTTDLRQRILRLIGVAFDDLEAWRDADIAAFVRQITPAIAAAQRQVGALTDGYISALASLEGAPVRPVGIPGRMMSSDVIRGVDATEVYSRVGHEIWNALARGNPLESAVKQGRDRALATARTDLQLAKTHAVAYVTERSESVTGYVRVPDGAACDLCLIAADQVYKTGELMAIHERCACDVEPLFGNDDRTASPEPAAPSDDVRVDVEEHGELGPVLVDAGHDFTGPDDF